MKTALLLARLALGTAFLSSVLSRFGVFGTHVGFGTFAGFMDYAHQMNPFVPMSLMPIVAWLATFVEAALGIALISGFQKRLTGYASCATLFVFAIEMAFAFGPIEPFSYSVFTASACSLLVAESSKP